MYFDLQFGLLIFVLSVFASLLFIRYNEMPSLLKIICIVIVVVGGMTTLAGVYFSEQYIISGTVCDKFATEYKEIQIDNEFYSVGDHTYAGVCKGDYIDVEVTSVWGTPKKQAKLLSASHVGCCGDAC